MNEKKIKWLKEIKQLLIKRYAKVEIIFLSSKKTNKYYYTRNKYIICDAVFHANDCLFIFEMLTDDKYLYRFSTKNKYFWQINRLTGERTKRDTNWIGLFIKGKTELDHFNNKYNKFHLLADYIDFDGSGNGIYGVTIKSFERLLNY